MMKQEEESQMQIELEGGLKPSNKEPSSANFSLQQDKHMENIVYRHA
jgi:hypothetical protein